MDPEMAFEMMEAWRDAGLPILGLKFSPSAYPPAQLSLALAVAAEFDRGPFFHLEDPQDA